MCSMSLGSILATVHPYSDTMAARSEWNMCFVYQSQFTAIQLCTRSRQTAPASTLFAFAFDKFHILLVDYQYPRSAAVIELINLITNLFCVCFVEMGKEKPYCAPNFPGLQL